MTIAVWLLQVREVVHDFYASRYASCLNQLQRLQPTLELDMHLHQHAAALCSAVSSANETASPFAQSSIRMMLSQNALVAAGEEQGACAVHSPLCVGAPADHGCRIQHRCSVSLCTLGRCADALVAAMAHGSGKGTCRGLEAEIAELIQGGQVQARIDSGSQVLYKRRANVRSATFAAAMQEGQLATAPWLLLRSNLSHHRVSEES